MLGVILLLAIDDVDTGTRFLMVLRTKLLSAHLTIFTALTGILAEASH